MRILFVEIEDAESAATWSGTTFSILEQFRRKHEIVLLHKLRKCSKLLYTPYALECKLRGLQFQLDRHPMVARSYAAQVEREYKRCSPDLVFSTSTIPIGYLPSRIPTATWTDAVMPDMVDFYWPSETYHPRTLSAGINLDQMAVRKNCVSFFSSNWAADGARRLAPESRERIHVVPYGANTVADPPLLEPKTLPNDAREPINFLFVGSDWVRKGGQASVDTVQMLRAKGHNVRLFVVGATPLDTQQCSDFIFQFGFLSRESDSENQTLKRLYREAHFFLMPTHAECSAIVFAEAASYGLPVIARDVGGVGSMVDKNRNSILVGRTDGPETIAQLVRRLLFDKQQYSAMSLASLRLFDNRLNWASAFCHVNGVLEKLAR